jgi:hypothetical protein
MVARPAPQLPDEHHSDGYAFEPKLDGWLNRTLWTGACFGFRRQPCLSSLAAAGGAFIVRAARLDLVGCQKLVLGR